MNIVKIQEKITPLFKRYNVAYAGIFGSVARGENNPNSDLDILVKFNGPSTFSAYLALDDSLCNALNLPIDLVTEGAVNKFLRPYIEHDLKIIYGQR